jgi:hypothetical protein
MAPSDAPMPMPAFAPVDSPLSLIAAAVFEAEEDEVVVDATDDGIETAEEAEDGVLEEEEMDEDGRAVRMGSPNRAAMVYRAMPLPSAQQLVVTPQHQVVESTHSSQGVTLTSVSLCDSRCSLLISLPLATLLGLPRSNIALDIRCRPSYFLYMIPGRRVGSGCSDTARWVDVYPNSHNRRY